LRDLGRDDLAIKRKENGRMRSCYRMTAFANRLDGNIAAEVDRRERARKQPKKAS